MRARLAALLLAGCSAATAGAPALDLRPCALRGVEHPALCGRVVRPLDPARSAGTAIDVHVAVLPALARHKHPDPVFFLAGGPGQSAIDLAAAAQRLLARLGNRRDLVLVDQRGTGRSAALACPDDDPLRPLAQRFDADAVQRDLARCRAALQALPYGDLKRYTTTLAMQDLDAVRQALGVRRVNLVGVSYGTRAALEYLRLHPQSVRRAVLDGVAPPDMVLPLSSAVDAQAALRALQAWCDADAACARQHPPLSRVWQALRERLPLDVNVQHPVSGRPESLRVTVDMLDALVRAPLHASALAAALPFALAEAHAGRWTPLVGLAAALGGGGDRRGAVAQGMHFSVVCAEDLPLLDRAAPSAAAAAGATASYRRACADWPRGDVPEAFYRVPPAPAPVLLLSGAVDPVTPPRHGERVAQALGAQARHVVVPHAGHGVLGLPCLRELAFRFIDAEDDAAALALDGDCARALPRPPMFRPPGAEGAP